jgi:hypothetical protein
VAATAILIASAASGGGLTAVFVSELRAKAMAQKKSDF